MIFTFVVTELWDTVHEQVCFFLVKDQSVVHLTAFNNGQNPSHMSSFKRLKLP